MSVQVPLLEKTDSKATKRVTPVEEIVSDGFDVKRFVESFEVLAEAGGGLAKLREFVLTLAVRGRLTHKMPSDGDADTLLAKLTVNDSTADKQSGLQSRMDQDAGPFILPRNWRWARFLAVASIDSHLVDPAGFLDLPHVAPDNIEKGTGRLLQYRTIREDGVTSSKHRFFAGQIVYSKIRPNLSKVVLVDFEGLCSADMYPLTAKIDRSFLQRFMLSRAFLDQVVREDNRLAMPKVNQEQLGGTLVAVPPLAEQKRIVARVDHLMSLCDDLEARQTKKRETGTRLTRSALEALTSAQGPEEFDSAWKRVVENFDVLFGGSASIDQLRQTALWLATHGRLLVRRSEEGNGKALLERLRHGNRRRWETSNLKEIALSATKPRNDSWKSKYLPAAEADDTDGLVVSLPTHWSSASLEELADVIDPNPSHRYPTYKGGTIPLLSTREFRGRDGWDASGSNVPLVPPEVHREQNERCRFSSRDIVLARKGRLGLARHPPPVKSFAFSHTVFVIKAVDDIDADYLLWYLRLDRVVTWLRGEMNDNTGVPTLGKATTERLPVPLPPLGEQRRIVAKVEQLMSVCDDLEASLRRAEETAGKLVEAVVAEMVA